MAKKKIWMILCITTAICLAGCSNISSDGYTIYYDTEQEENAWLGGETIELDGGGTLTPAEE